MFVTGTPSGHCPRCGFVPPSVPVLSPRITDLPRALWLALVLVLVLAIAVLLR